MTEQWAQSEIESLATIIQESFPSDGGGYLLVWEDCFPAAIAILDAGWVNA
jgi:hypothetical protein